MLTVAFATLLAAAVPPALTGATLVAAEGHPLKNVPVLVVTADGIAFAPDLKTKAAPLMARKDVDDKSADWMLAPLAAKVGEAKAPMAIVAAAPDVPFSFLKRALYTLEKNKVVPAFAVQARNGVRIVLDTGGPTPCLVEAGDDMSFEAVLKKALPLVTDERLVMIVPASSPKEGCMTPEGRAALAAQPPPKAEPVMIEGADKDAIEAVIMKKGEQIVACLGAVSSHNPTASGRIDTSFIVQPDGTVTDVKAESTTLAKTSAPKCLVDVLGTLKFPKTSTGKPVKVGYPFILTAADGTVAQ